MEYPLVSGPWGLCWLGLFGYEQALKLPRTWGSTVERAESSELGGLLRVLGSSMKTRVENIIESRVKSFSIELLFVDSTVVLSRGELLFNFESSRRVLRKVYDSHHCIH